MKSLEKKRKTVGKEAAGRVGVLEVFDPPMCCSTGVCGPNVGPVLPRFAADLEWLGKQGVKVSRFNLAQQAGMFTGNKTVSNALKKDGKCLPLVLINGKIVSRRKYPKRAELAGFLGLKAAADRGKKSSGCKCCCC